MKKKMESELYKDEKGNGEWAERERWRETDEERKYKMVIRGLATVIF